MAKKIERGLWYQCKHSFGLFTEGNYYYAPMDGMLNANDNRAHIVPCAAKKWFGNGEVIKITEVC
jgi:hypothetical protein